MTRHREELSPRQAASLLECHVKTVYRWCEQALAGAPSKLARVRQLPSGRLRI